MDDSRESRRAAGRERVLAGLLSELRPWLRRDPALPARIERRLARDRRFGSTDRRRYRDQIYAALRYLPWIEEALARDPSAAAVLAAALAGSTEAATARAAALGRDAAELLPAWLREECPEAFEPARLDAFLSRAPLWLRLRSEADRPALEEFAERGWSCRPSGLLPLAVRVEPAGAPVEATRAHRAGAFEIQDLGSQLVLESAGIGPGGRWLDACAGAGGKSLQLAGLLGAGGRVDALDVRPAALDELGRRAARAGCAERIARPSAPRPPYDGVLLDAPCSGSGTWRRAPHLKACTGPADVAAQALRQRELLEVHAPSVRPGGLLVYATCSLCRSENEDVVSSFLARHPEFAARPSPRPLSGRSRGPGLLFLPPEPDGDGFFVATLVRTELASRR